jgi:hypothetical protein
MRTRGAVLQVWLRPARTGDAPLIRRRREMARRATATARQPSRGVTAWRQGPWRGITERRHLTASPATARRRARRRWRVPVRHAGSRPSRRPRSRVGDDARTGSSAAPQHRVLWGRLSVVGSPSASHEEDTTMPATTSMSPVTRIHDARCVREPSTAMCNLRRRAKTSDVTVGVNLEHHAVRDASAATGRARGPSIVPATKRRDDSETPDEAPLSP